MSCQGTQTCGVGGCRRMNVHDSTYCVVHSERGLGSGMTEQEIIRLRDKTLKDLPACTSQLVAGRDGGGYRLLVNYAGQSQIIESEEQLDQFLERFGVKT